MTILITGTTRGIGEALAAHYLSLGHDVIGCGRTQVGMGDYRVCDVGNEEDVTRLAEYVRKEYGNLDVLINNAGAACMNHFLTTPIWSIENVLHANFYGTVFMCQTFARILRGGHGRIVNFTSAAVPWNLPGEAVYAASKAAVESLTRTLAFEFAPLGITVNAVGPTPTPTALLGKMPQDKIDALLARQAIPRMATMEDIVNVVDFFVRAESDYVTGQVIYLGGVS